MAVCFFVDATTLRRLLARAFLLLVDELCAHSDNDILPGKFGTRLRIHTWKPTA